MLTKGAIGNLINRYKAVLKKCNLINTFGSLAVASVLVLGGAGVAGAAEYNLIDRDTTISSNNFEANVTGDSIFVVKAGSTLTIEDGANITVTNKIPVKVTLPPNQGQSYDATHTATLIVNGGTLKSEQWFGISGNGNRHNTAITINGGTIEVPMASIILRMAS